MRNYLVYAGRDSRDFGVYITGSGTYDAPAKDYKTYPVPGRSGDLVLPGNRWANGSLKYPAFIAGRNFEQNIADFRSFLNAHTGYQRLIDSYHPDEFRNALFDSAIKVDVTKLRDAGTFDITFNVDPRRFLLSGETVTTLTATGTIFNPAPFASKPLLRVYGTGTVGIGNVAVTINRNASYIDIDCDLLEAYRGTTPLNSDISLSGLYFPELEAGTNNIVLDGVTKVEITPRWWKI